jgi:hypothetical protein
VQDGAIFLHKPWKPLELIREAKLARVSASVFAAARTSTFSATAKNRKLKAGSAKENLHRKLCFLMYASCTARR